MTHEAPICPVHGTPLRMLEKYMFAPSIAFCETGGHLVEVAYDYDLAEWIATIPKEPA